MAQDRCDTAYEIYKIYEYIMSNYGRDEYEEVVDDMSFGDMEAENSLIIAAGTAAYIVLFVRQDKNGKTLADRWEAQGWEGLNNDEKVMMRYLKSSRATIVEIQKIFDHQAMECIDIFDPGKKSFLLFDRSTASHATRFSRIFSWLTHFPHLSRMTHGGITVTDFIAGEFLDMIKEDARKASRKDRACKFKDYLIAIQIMSLSRLPIVLFESAGSRGSENIPATGRGAPI